MGLPLSIFLRHSTSVKSNSQLRFVVSFHPSPITPHQMAPFPLLQQLQQAAKLAVRAPTPTFDGHLLEQRQVDPPATVTVVATPSIATPTVAVPTVTVTTVPTPAVPTTTTVVADSESSGGGGNDGMNAGEIAGIVIGVVVAVALIIWAIRALSTRDKKQPNYYHQEKSGGYGHRHHRHHHGHHHHHRHSSRGRSRSTRSRSRSVSVVRDAPRSPSRVYYTR